MCFTYSFIDFYNFYSFEILSGCSPWLITVASCNSTPPATFIQKIRGYEAKAPSFILWHCFNTPPIHCIERMQKKKNGMQEREKSMDRDICHFLMPFSRGRVNRSMFLFFRKQWTEMTSREVAQI
jgi:hypothetical protein